MISFYQTRQNLSAPSLCALNMLVLDIFMVASQCTMLYIHIHIVHFIALLCNLHSFLGHIFTNHSLNP